MIPLAIILVLLMVFYVLRNKTKGEYTKCESPIESKLYWALTNKGYNVITQKWIGKYRVDLCLPIYRLVIECDGHSFHSSPDQKKYDAKRTRYLNRQGWRVIRFTGSQINRNPYECVSKVNKKVGRACP